MSANRGIKGKGDEWDVKGKDVPGGRMRRSVMKGLTHTSPKDKATIKSARHAALDRIRAHARAADDARDRDALWSLVARIGYVGHPTWEEVTAARTGSEFLTLAYRGENEAEKTARRDRDATRSDRRTIRHSVAEYLEDRERRGFSAEGQRGVASILRRTMLVEDDRSGAYSDRRLITITTEDARRICNDLARSPNLPDGVEQVEASTQDKNERTLKAWWNWELTREKERARSHNRTALYTDNPFADHSTAYSRPIGGRGQTIEQKEHSRRFNPEECKRLEAGAPLKLKLAIPVLHRLGLRPGELLHLRFGLDVRPLPDGDGYEVLIQGGRGRNPQCVCAACQSAAGWQPKNGPRRYILRRSIDGIGWITPAIDALDTWISLHEPEEGEHLYPSDTNRERFWSNGQLNTALRETGKLCGIEIGKRAPGRRTAHSFRHACASEMLELGVPHALAAEWIGDTLQVFMKTYGRPDPLAVAQATLAKRIT
jgi:integrase